MSSFGAEAFFDGTEELAFCSVDGILSLKEESRLGQSTHSNILSILNLTPNGTF
ncbi:hypothetical protein QEH52_16315 [Coraliomargarita sp. SDUM461003]|uniref:Uncharacterized protein n=1 Tax=Thalassobacterium maritimum TaxID=3041265 RepID=A0ABU1AYD7_9BACT|nr:hypothetical protein [Coraliomargarita sp. SDUM461003]MDQ8209091.1 hypothetical protein [Coraliomargarita sp. SDUM461003]